MEASKTMYISKTGVLALAVTAALNATSVLAVDPYQKADESWISIGGTVVDPKADRFILDYGPNMITVEVDDWDAYSETYGLLDGDQVRVYGRVDDDMFEATTIEAGSIYIYGLNTYIYASSADEEDLTSSFNPYYWTTTSLPPSNEVTVRGTVTAVDPAKRQFKVNRGSRELTVNTLGMGYNPLDKLGFQQIQSGDVVSVSGTIDYDFFGSRVLDANLVTTILDVSNVPEVSEVSEVSDASDASESS